MSAPWSYLLIAMCLVYALGTPENSAGESGQLGKAEVSNLSITSNVTQVYVDEDPVRCPPGYRPSSANVTCVMDCDGFPRWNETDQCIRLCNKPEAKNLSITGDIKAYYDIGDVVSVRCDAGYRPSSNDIVCEDRNGTLQWNATAQCLGLCKKPSASHLSITSDEADFYDINDVVTVSCDPGYGPSSANVTCSTDPDGLPQWDEDVRCKGLCDKPTAKFLSITGDIKAYYDIGDVVSVRCDAGYRPSSNDIVCEDRNGTLQWNATAQCLGRCQRPAARHLNISSDGNPYYDVGDVVKLRCDTGYGPSSKTIVCENHNGSFQWNVTAQCLAKCKMPENTDRKDQNYIKLHNVNRTISVKCTAGYHPLYKTITCKSAGDRAEWDHPQPCTAQCKNPEIINVETLSVVKEFYDVNDSVEVTCKKGYWPSPKRMTCVLGGDGVKWNLTSRCTVPESPTIKQIPTMENNTIRWEMSDTWGNVTAFQMNISASRDYNTSFILQESFQFFPNVTKYELPLQHGTNYTVTLRGFTLAGAGNVTTLLVETEIGDPPRHVQKAMNHSTLQLFPVHDLYGPISSYEIIVFGGQESNMSAKCLTSENSHYNSSRTSSHYTAAVLPARNLTGSRTFILGDNQYYNGFHNPPLAPQHAYTIYIRVTSQWKQVNKSSCAFAGFLAVTAAEPPSNTTQIIAGSLSAVILLLILLILVIVWRCRSAGKSRRSHDIPMKAKTGPGKKRDIPVDHYLDVVKRFRRMEIADTNDGNEEDAAMLPVGRYQEYEELPGVLMHLCSVGLSQENQAKNRYKKVLPYDEWRVVLRSSHSSSDYINASYIHGYKAPKFYIATQGPIPETVPDFWSMVWQENSSVIVMLTGLEEQSKVKCERYWPEQSQTYGDITVSVQKTVHTGAFTIRSFSLKRVQSAVQMMVEQIHYLRWPDHGVPKNTSDMVQLVDLMNKCNTPGSGAVIVHCSAGIGRTGTFLALDILLKMAHAVKKVNVYNCVLELRKQRMKMVQEKEQYIFLYDVLLETLLCGSTSFPVSEIYKRAHCTTNMDEFNREFQALEKITELYQIYPCKEGKKLENQTKNRNYDILPGDHWRPILLSALTRHGAPGYINAVFVNSNSQDDALIVTQLPMKQTLVDFWALVWDYKCTAVVMMQREQDLKENGVRFWPEMGETSYGAFKVRTTEKSPGNGYTASTLNLRKTNEASDISLEVRLFQMDSWPLDQCLPESPAALISLIGDAEKCQQQISGSHILVTCRDGAGRSGLFCAGVIICDQIRSDGCLDASQAVRSLRRRRCQFIPNVEQYSYCYTLAESYLDSFETYGNFK